MKQIVVMPGGFHPFHAGHASLYQSALKAFPDADVYVAATNDQKTRPFPFAIKEKLAKVAGVAPGHFVQVKSPFKAEEITKNYDPNEDVLIFVRSEKDKTEQPKPGGTKKDGSPAYFQPYTGKDLQPFSKHAYIAYLPTIEFGPGIKSASEIRELWPRLNDKRKLAMVMSLYPATQKNPKLANNVKQLLDMGMGEQEQLAEYKTKVLDQPKTTNVYYKPRHSDKTYLIGKDVPGQHIDKFIDLVKHKYSDLRDAGPDEIFWNVERQQDMAEGDMKPTHVTGEEKPGAVETLEKALVKAKKRGIKLDYDKIDKMMQLICKEHNLTGDKLHDDFVEKHHMWPDTWIEKHANVTESVDYVEEK
jgi:hypothetical protein